MKQKPIVFFATEYARKNKKEKKNKKSYCPSCEIIKPNVNDNIENLKKEN